MLATTHLFLNMINNAVILFESIKSINTKHHVLFLLKHRTNATPVRSKPMCGPRTCASIPDAFIFLRCPCSPEKGCQKLDTTQLWARGPGGVGARLLARSFFSFLFFWWGVAGFFLSFFGGVAGKETVGFGPPWRFCAVFFFNGVLGPSWLFVLVTGKP